MFHLMKRNGREYWTNGVYRRRIVTAKLLEKMEVKVFTMCSLMKSKVREETNRITSYRCTSPQFRCSDITG